MPDFTFRGPIGNDEIEVNVTGPEGATEEQAWILAQQQLRAQGIQFNQEENIFEREAHNPYALIDNPGDVSAPIGPTMDAPPHRNFVAGAGALAGHALSGGLRAGPLGLIVGPAVGAAVATSGYESVLDVLRASGVEGMSESPNFLERVQRAGNEALMEAAFSVVGLPGATPAMLKPLRREADNLISTALRGDMSVLATQTQNARESIDAVRRVDGIWARTLGVSEEGINEARVAEELGVDVGILQTTRGQLHKMWSMVLGRFPFWAGVARRNADTMQQQAIDAKDRMFLRVGPSMNETMLGTNLNRSLDKNFKAFRDYINARYEAVFRIAKEEGATIPSGQLKRSASAHMKAFERRYGPLKIRNEQGDLINNPKFEGHPVLAFYKNVLDLPRDVSFERYRGLADELDSTMTRAGKEAYDVSLLAHFKAKGMERALNNITNTRVKDLLQRADSTFHRIMYEVFESPTGQRFERRVTKSRFHLGIERPGTTNVDQTFKIAFEQQRDSAAAVKDLRRLVGRNNVLNAARRHIDGAWRSSRTQNKEGKEIFSTDNFRKKLGLHDPDSAEWAALDESLKGSGVTARDVKNLADTVDLTLRNAPDGVNVFIARRANMAGLKGITGAIAPMFTTGAAGAAAASGNLMGGASLFVVGLSFITSRQFGRMVSTPRMLALSKTAFDPAQKMQVRRNALMIMVRTMNPDANWDTLEGIEQGLFEILSAPSASPLVEPEDDNEFEVIEVGNEGQ